MIDAKELKPVISALQKAIGGSAAQTKEVFITIFLAAHGYASMIANNSLKYNEELIQIHLERAYKGAVLAMCQGKQNEKIILKERADLRLYGL